jgi:hypothetical protein
MTTPPPSYDPQGQPTPPAYTPASDPGYAAPAAPGYAPPVSDNAGPRPKGPATLGIVAFAVALLGAIAGSVLAYLGGVQLGSLVQYAEVTGGTTSLDSDTLPAAGQQAAVAGAGLAFAGFAVWGVLALWGFIQGIIATVKNRGRVWGILAIVVAVLGVVAVLVMITVGTATGAAPYVPGS